MKKQKILRILSLAMLTVLLTGALAGCGEQEPKEELTAGQIAEKLAALAEAQGLESAADYADVFYGQADFDKVEEFEVLSPMMNVKASEIAVFRAKDESDAPALQQALEQRAQDVQASFEFYLEDQYAIAQKAIVRRKGAFVCLVIDENASEIAEEFEKLVA